MRRFVSVRGFKEGLGPCRSDLTTDYRRYKITVEDKALPLLGMPHLVPPTSLALSLNVDRLELVFCLLG